MQECIFATWNIGVILNTILAIIAQQKENIPLLYGGSLAKNDYIWPIF
jgi:hypothetical protein